MLLTVILALTCFQEPIDAEAGPRRIPGKENARAKARALLLMDQDRRERAAASKADHACGCGYDAALAESKANGSTLIVVVGAKRHDLEKSLPWKVLHVPAGCHELPEGVIVSRGGNWIKTLPTSATGSDVLNVLAPPRFGPTSWTPPPVLFRPSAVNC
jgi:hypothetical protein